MKVQIRVYLLAVLALMLSFQLHAQNKKAKKSAGYTSTDYEISCAGVGVEGTKLVSVSSYGRNPEEATRNAKRNVIHGIIFKGAYGKTNGCQGVKALSSGVNDEEKFKKYFNKFFKPGGKYLQFVSDSDQANREVLKIDKRTYKVKIIASVLYDNLRTELEQANVIKKLSHGF